MNFFAGLKRCRCSNLLFTGLIVLVVGGWFAITGMMDWMGTSQKMPDMQALAEKDFKSGKYVEGDVTTCFGAFYEMYSSNGPKWLNTRKNNLQRIYLTAVGKKKNLLIGVKVNENDFDELNTIMSVTIKGAQVPNNQAVHCFGRVESYNAKMQDAVDEYMRETGIEAKVLPYYIDFSEANHSHISAYIGFGTMLVGLLIILLGFVPKYRKEIMSIRMGVNQSVGQVIYEAPNYVRTEEKKMSVFGDEDFERFMREGEEKDGDQWN